MRFSNLIQGPACRPWSGHLTEEHARQNNEIASFFRGLNSRDRQDDAVQSSQLSTDTMVSPPSASLLGYQDLGALAYQVDWLFRLSSPMRGDYFYTGNSWLWRSTSEEAYAASLAWVLSAPDRRFVEDPRAPIICSIEPRSKRLRLHMACLALASPASIAAEIAECRTAQDKYYGEKVAEFLATPSSHRSDAILRYSNQISSYYRQPLASVLAHIERSVSDASHGLPAVQFEPLQPAREIQRMYNYLNKININLRHWLREEAARRTIEDASDALRREELERRVNPPVDPGDEEALAAAF